MEIWLEASSGTWLAIKVVGTRQGVSSSTEIGAWAHRYVESTSGHGIAELWDSTRRDHHWAVNSRPDQDFGVIDLDQWPIDRHEPNPQLLQGVLQAVEALPPGEPVPYPQGSEVLERPKELARPRQSSSRRSGSMSGFLEETVMAVVVFVLVVGCGAILVAALS